MQIPAFLLILFCPFFLLGQPLNVSVEAEAVFLFNVDTGAVLYQKNPHKQLYPASTMKITAALYALEKAQDLEAFVTIDQDCIATITVEQKQKSNFTLPAHLLETGYGHMCLKKGEQIKLKDLFYGMLIGSACDASNAIAKHISGSIPKFMEELNLYVKEVGCKNSHFMNPHGLHHPDQLSTAYDLALIGARGLKNPIFRKIVSTPRYTCPKTNKKEEFPLLHTNRLIRPGKYFYPKAIGIKTGSYSLALNSIVAAAYDEEQQRTLIAVLLRCKDRGEMFQDVIKLFETAFKEKKEKKVLLNAGKQKFAVEIKPLGKEVKTYTEQPVILEYYPAEEPVLKCLLYLNELPLPIKKDQVIGKLSFVDENGKEAASVALLALEEVKRDTWEAFKNFFLKIPIFLLGILFITGFLFWFFKR